MRHIFTWTRAASVDKRYMQRLLSEGVCVALLCCVFFLCPTPEPCCVYFHVLVLCFQVWIDGLNSLQHICPSADMITNFLFVARRHFPDCLPWRSDGGDFYDR